MAARLQSSGMANIRTACAGRLSSVRTPLPPASSHWFVQPWCKKATTAYSAQNVRLAPGARSDIHVMTAIHRHHTGGSMAIALLPNCRQRLRLNLRTAITTTQLNRFVAPTAYWGLPSKAALTVTAIYSPPQNGPFGHSKQAETACRTAHTATPNSTKAQPSGCQQITRSLNSKAQDRQTGLEV